MPALRTLARQPASSFLIVAMLARRAWWDRCCTVALLANLFPARRAASVDPMAELRAE
jgi:hypothetical protein